MAYNKLLSLCYYVIKSMLLRDYRIQRLHNYMFALSDCNNILIDFLSVKQMDVFLLCRFSANSTW